MGRDNDITDILEESFSTTEDRFGELVEVELKPGGQDLPVTEENKEEYVELLVEYRIAKRVGEQFKAFLEGFAEAVPLELVKVFDENELELLIGGVSEIDMCVQLQSFHLIPKLMSHCVFRDDWTKFTDYRGYEKTDQVIEWFWQCLRSWPAERKARLLQFTTGTSRVPVNGFKDLQGSDGPRRFTIEKSGDPNGLPRSHTCFNRLDLPPYEDYESLEKKLLFAIEYVSSPRLLRAWCADRAFVLVGRPKGLGRSERGLGLVLCCAPCGDMGLDVRVCGLSMSYTLLLCRCASSAFDVVYILRPYFWIYFYPAPFYFESATYIQFLSEDRSEEVVVVLSAEVVGPSVVGYR